MISSYELLSPNSFRTEVQDVYPSLRHAYRFTTEHPEHRYKTMNAWSKIVIPRHHNTIFAAAVLKNWHIGVGAHTLPSLVVRDNGDESSFRAMNSAGMKQHLLSDYQPLHDAYQAVSQGLHGAVLCLDPERVEPALYAQETDKAEMWVPVKGHSFEQTVLGVIELAVQSR